MYIIGKKVKNGVTCRVLQGDDGKQTLIADDLLKSYIAQGKIIVENAELKGNRLYVKPISILSNKIGYSRLKELSKLNRQEKARYYFDTILETKTLMDMSIFSIDELDCILEGTLSLEVSDQGSSTVDMILNNNIHAFSSLSAVINECSRRNYLTEEESRQYLLGTNEKGRICNQMSYTEWILQHKKRR